jgi:hypothetical protein
MAGGEQVPIARSRPEHILFQPEPVARACTSAG